MFVVCLQTDVESDTEEDESELESGFGEEVKSDEDLEEELDPHSSKFRPAGTLMTYEEEPNFEGYLMVKVGRALIFLNFCFLF